MSTLHARLRQAPVLLFVRNGAGSGTTLLDATYRGTTIALAGADRILFRLRYTQSGATGINVRVRDASDDGDSTIAAGTFPLLSQTTSHSSGAGELKTVHAYSASTDDLVYVDCKGMVGKFAFEVQTTGGAPSSGDIVRVEMVAVEG
jgi:hypothetical protein